MNYREPIKNEVKTENRMAWVYETDDMEGVCIIARDLMTIRFQFKTYGNEFPDVLKINEILLEKLKEPVSVEGMADFLHSQFPTMTIRVCGRADSHGWITAYV